MAENEALPNLWGQLWCELNAFKSPSGVFSEVDVRTDYTVETQSRQTWEMYRRVTFDARSYNPIYGRASEVRPKNLALVYWLRSQ